MVLRTRSTTAALMLVTLTLLASRPLLRERVLAESTRAIAQATGGIAAFYPGDVGIENDPNVVFVERFEELTLTSLFTKWTDILRGVTMVLSSDVPPGSPGSHSLDIPWVGGGVNNGGHLYKVLSPGVSDTLYVRYYIKYPTSA